MEQVDNKLITYNFLHLLMLKIDKLAQVPGTTIATRRKQSALVRAIRVPIEVF